MKKIIILILCMVFLSGCYDYHEINKIDIVSAIGIDYQDGEYIFTLEVLNDKIDKESAKVTSYTKSGKDSELATALEKAASKLTNEATYSHVRLLVISKSVAEEKFESLIDFFLRSTYFRENFYVVSSIDNSPEDILSNVTDNNPIASTTILEMLESNNYASNSSILKNFDQVTEEIITFGKDTGFSNITLDDEQFLIDGAVIFDDFKYKAKLDNELATIYNIFTDNIYRPIFKKNDEGKYFAVAILTGKPEIKTENGKLLVSGTLTGKIMNNETNYNIRDLETLDKINSDFEKIIAEKFAEFLKILQENESDILGISEMHYKDTRKKEDDFWINLEIRVNTKFLINKKGLIYEVINEN